MLLREPDGCVERLLCGVLSLHRLLQDGDALLEALQCYYVSLMDVWNDCSAVSCLCIDSSKMVMHSWKLSSAAWLMSPEGDITHHNVKQINLYAAVANLANTK